MIQKQYETGSCNLIKGDFKRSIASIISLAKAEKAKTLELPDYEPQYDLPIPV